jgi:hypothetical protein
VLSEPAPSPLLEPEFQALPPEGMPLLQRASASRVSCRVQRAPEITDEQDRVVLPSNGGNQLVHSGSEHYGLFIAPLDAQGRLGTSEVLDDRDGRIFYLQARAGANRTTLLWSRNWFTPEQESHDDLNVAQLDEQGKLLAAPHALTGFSVGEYGSQLVARDGGFAAFWTEHNAYGGPYALRFGRMDASGELVGTPLTLRTQDEAYLLTTSLNRLGDGFVATYRGSDPSTDYGGFMSLFLDSAGSALGPPVHLAANYWSAVLPRGNRILAAWSVLYEGAPTANTVHLGGQRARAHTLRIGWFDLRGKPLGPSFDLQPPLHDQENADPAWVDLGDDVGLVWSRGSEIYICSGCVPDHELNFVVLDGTTLSPKSSVLRVTNPGSRGGLLQARLSRLGPDLLLLAERTFHTSSEALSAVLRCEASNP